MAQNSEQSVDRLPSLLTYGKGFFDSMRRRPGRFFHDIKAVFRYYGQWRRSFLPEVNSLSDEAPWIPFECREYLESLTGPKDFVFEYGSGGSTLYLARRVEKLVSVEHDNEWYSIVSRIIEKEGLENCEYYLHPPKVGLQGDSEIGYPPGYQSDGFPGEIFSEYVRSIDSYADESFDLVLVDGRARNACIWHACSKVKPGGYLVLDNSERESYREGRDLVSNWVCREFYGPGPYIPYFWGATVWRKPHSSSG